MNLTSFPWCSHSKGEGGILYEPSCPSLRPLTHGEGSELISSLLYKVRGRFNCELRYSALAFSLEGQVFSANLPFPISRPLNQVNSYYLTSSPPKAKEGFTG